MTGDVTLECHPAGHALLVRAGPPFPEQKAFIAGLATDPEHTAVIIDLDGDYPDAAWEPVLRELSGLPGSLRLLPWQQLEGGFLRIGQWLADQLERVVLAPDGDLVAAARGGLFVSPGSGAGWHRMEPGKPPEADSRRFPKPRWTAAAPLEDAVALSAATVLQPLPGGAWLYVERGAEPDADGHRPWSRPGRWLYSEVAWSDETITVVLGYPGGLPLPVSDVARLWSTLPDDARQRVRFLRYGTEVPSGQELADTLGHHVVVLTGAPVSGWRAADPVRSAVLDGDGTPGWEPFTTEVSYVPDGEAPRPAAAVLPDSLAGLEELSPGVYAVAPGVVLEVVASGLWFRPDAAPPGAASLRRGPADPRRPVVWVDATLPGPPEEATAAVLEMLGLELRARCEVRPIDTTTPRARIPEPAPEPEPAGAPEIRLESSSPAPRAFILPGAPATDEQEAARGQERPSVRDDDLVGGPRAEPPAGPPAGVAVKASPVPAAEPQARMQPVPLPKASAVPPERGIEKERLWLQKSLSREYAATANLVARVLSQTPGLRVGAGGTRQDTLTDLVAVRLYLAEHGQRIDDAVRIGKVGPHVPFARCVAAGLRRLPSYRGAARLRATLTDVEYRWYGGRRLVTEWAFCPALTDGSIELPGSVDFLIWSVTARRTSLLAPDIASQVLFLPGTSFKVLDVREGERREVLLRELAVGEIGPDGQVETGQVPLDDVAMSGLEKAGDTWARARRGGALPERHARRFANPPGLILGKAESLPLAGASQTGEGGAA